MDLLSIVLLLIIIYGSIRAVHSLSSSRSTSSPPLPPGPKGLPIIGNLHQLGDKPHKSLTKLAKTHGPIMSLKLGQITTIVVSSSNMAKQVLQTFDNHLSSRTIPDALHIHDHEVVGFPWISTSPLWRSYRKICNTQLFSAKALDSNQTLRTQKVKELYDHLMTSASAGEAVDIGAEAFTATLNMLSNTIFSVDFADPKSELAREFKDVSWNIMKEAGTPNLGDYFPAVKRVDFQGIRRRMTVHFGRVLELFGGIVEERLKLRKKSESFNDVLDTLLDIVESDNGEINSHQMIHLLLVLFVAGTDTTAVTFQWAMAELLQNPKVLTKARAELNEIIGKEKSIVEESDISRLPYLQAILKETFRLHPSVPLLLPRKSKADVEIEGFIVPKGSQILVNTWAIGRDSNLWDRPEEFRPKRFLGSKIDVRGQSFEVVPFGGGRRICPGIPLAMRMLHMMLGTVIHSFEWRLEDGVDVDMEDKFGITLEMAKPLRAIPIST